MKNSKIVEIFNKFKKDPQMHTDFYQDGCIYRTRKLCDYIIENSEFAGEKIFFVRISPIQDKGKVICNSASLKNLKNEKICWDEHWIPLVFDENNNPIALDICLMDGPEKLNDYIFNFDNAEIKQNDICDARYKYDYMLFLINNRWRYDLSKIANNPYNEEYKIFPNMIHSNWLKKQRKAENYTDSLEYMIAKRKVMSY